NQIGSTSSSSSTLVEMKVTSQLLQIVDHLNLSCDSPPLFLIATTSHLDRIHPSLLRARRFERVFTIPIPTPSSRHQILLQYATPCLRPRTFTDKSAFLPFGIRIF